MDTSGTDDNSRHRCDLLNEVYPKAISTVGRIDDAKEVTALLELVPLEREAYGISTVDAGNADPLSSLLKAAVPCLVVADPPGVDSEG
jgi:hypothetical protein